VVWTCGTDGGRKTTNRGFTWTRGGKEKQKGGQRKIWMDNVREHLKEKNIDLTRIGEATRNMRLMEERKEEEAKHNNSSLQSLSSELSSQSYCRSH